MTERQRNQCRLLMQAKYTPTGWLYGAAAMAWRLANGSKMVEEPKDERFKDVT